MFDIEAIGKRFGYSKMGLTPVARTSGDRVCVLLADQVEAMQKDKQGRYGMVQIFENRPPYSLLETIGYGYGLGDQVRSTLSVNPDNLVFRRYWQVEGNGVVGAHWLSRSEFIRKRMRPSPRDWQRFPNVDVYFNGLGADFIAPRQQVWSKLAGADLDLLPRVPNSYHGRFALDYQGRVSRQSIAAQRIFNVIGGDGLVNNGGVELSYNRREEVLGKVEVPAIPVNPRLIPMQLWPKRRWSDKKL